jgi:thiamine-phosphate pyrophosphorylase
MKMNATLASAARTLKSHARAKKKRGLPSLILLTDETRRPDPRAAIERLPPGSGVIFRHYGHPRRAGVAKELAALCRRRRLWFIVGGDARLALAVKADGLHLRERDLARRILPAARRLFVTAAAHSRSTLVAARRKGADAALLGPVFETPSHPGAPVLGPLRFGLMTRASPFPVYALGGIGPQNARRLLGRGAAGIAGIGAFAPAL